MSTLRILCIGDVVGRTGRKMFEKHIKPLREKYALDMVLVNGENSADDGRGITPTIMNAFKDHGADVVTSGNHIWAKRDIYPYLNQHTDLLRPANFPQEAPGKGVTFVTTKNGYEVGVINLQGRVFMRELTACPFRTADSLLTYVKSRTPIVLVDMHAEATSEKLALAYYLEGRVSAVFGTHTHIQTADARILPGKTAYITDLGMTGSLNSMIGMTKEPILKQFLTQTPVRFAVDTSTPIVMSGIMVTVDATNGQALEIEPVRIYDNNQLVQEH